MATITDPATELANLAANLLDSVTTKGATYIAEKLGVEPWSGDFCKIITCVVERTELVANIVQNSDLDTSNKVSVLAEISTFKTAFSGPSLGIHWNNGSGGFIIMKDQGKILGYLQSTVRPIVSYPKLDAEEIVDLIELIDAYLLELQKSSEGPLFVRQAIRDGLLAFRFQLKYVGWMGSGYLLKEFRVLAETYRQANDYYGHMNNVDASAVLSGMWTVIQRFRSVVETVKPYTDAASYLIAGYSLVQPYVGFLPPADLLAMFNRSTPTDPLPPTNLMLPGPKGD